ncbi:MAG: MotA/TolQ/ExbB proton channel family protein [Planctomycetes bacterium]|nr:MotA/TolQ/ExbB proton channel family protein [Planctomycetota bacterium]
MARKLVSAALLVLALAVFVPVAASVFPAPAFGEDAAAQVVKERTLWDNIKAGGLTEMFIILLSIVGLALSIQGMVELRRDRQIPPHVLQEIEGLVEEQNYEEALDYCDSEDNFLANVAGAALTKISNGYDRMLDATGEAVEENASILNTRISYLSLIASVAPMLGLLGTVLGMIEAFNVIAAMQGATTPAELADGISKALITTATGLIVAIPILVVYMFLRNRVMRITQEVTVLMGEILDSFRQ